MHTLFYRFLEAASPVPPPTLELESENFDSVPGLKEEIQKLREQLNSAGVSDTDLDRDRNGKIYEDELKRSAEDLYEKNPQNEKLKDLVQGNFKRIATHYVSKGDYSREHLYFKALTYDPQNIEANYQYGSRRRDPFFLEQALKLDPQYEDARWAFVNVWVERKDFSRAKKEAEEWIQLDPKNKYAPKALGRVYAALGEAQMWEGRSVQALPNLEKAVQLDPKHARAHLALGGIFYHRKNFNRAMNELALAATLDPNANKEIIAFFLAERRLKDAKNHLLLLATQRPEHQAEIGNFLFEIEMGQLTPEDRKRILMLSALQYPQLQPLVGFELALSR